MATPVIKVKGIGCEKPHGAVFTAKMTTLELYSLINTKTPDYQGFESGAQRESRTLTPSRAVDFESTASADSAIRAGKEFFLNAWFSQLARQYCGPRERSGLFF